VVGPTAVGKTALAEEIASRLAGEIVSADSMQVYRGMDIGTAKPAPEDRRVPYHCIDLVEPGEAYSAALYQQAARAAFAECADRMSLPVLCGGTGLYVRAALDPLEFPAGEQRTLAREAYEAFVAANGAEALHALLKERDPASAELVHPNNVRRVIRALEMLADETTYAEQSAGFSQRESVYPCAMIGLSMDRGALNTRIDARVDAMLERGLLGEVEGLLARGLREALTAAQAIGYKELVPVIEDGASLEVAIDSIKRASRRYAKRQLTWFRSDPRIHWIDVTDSSLSQVTDKALAVIDSAAPAGAIPRHC
jgi:tRNA dimethylallyltransferase